MARRRLLLLAMCAGLSVVHGPAHGVEQGPTSVDDARNLFEDELYGMAYISNMAKNRYDAALQMAEQAIEAHPADLEWRRRAARCAELAGKPATALNYWVYLVKQGDGAARQEALRLSRSMNELPVRRSLLETILMSGDGDSELLKEYLLVSERLGSLNEAYQLLSSGFRFGERAALLKEQARLAESLNRPADAVNALDTLAQIRPLTPAETVQRARLMYGAGDLQRNWQATAGVSPLMEAGADESPRRGYRWSKNEEKAGTRHRIAIDPPSVGAQVRYEFNQDDRNVTGGKQLDRSHIVTERLDLESKGYLYHPALLQFRLKFSPEFAQSITRSNAALTGSSNGSSDAFSPNYQANVTLLGQKPYTLTAFGQHLENRSWAIFTGVTSTTSESYGADLTLKYELLPTSVGLSSSRSDQEGYYGASSDWRELHLLTRNRNNLTGESSLSLSYSLNNQSTNGISGEIRTITSVLNNRYPVTKDERVTLSSNLQYLGQSGSALQNDSLFLNELLAWQHRPNLRSSWQYIFRRVNAGSSTSSWHSLDARLTHRLYENLTTMAGVTGSSNEADGGRQQSAGGVLQTDYQRALGGWGVVGLSAGVTPVYTTRSGSRGSVQITNEPHTLRNGAETFLTQSDVSDGSIVITNSAGSVIYVQDLDYRADLIGRSIRISRLPLGSIGDGQLILVSYRYTRNAGYDDLVVSQQYGASVELFRTLFLNYRYLQSDQRLLGGPSPDLLNNSRMHLASIRIDEGWGESGCIYEDTTSNSDLSYGRWEAYQSLRLQYGNWFRWNMRGYYGETRYRSIVDLKKSYGGVLGLTWFPFTWLNGALEGYLERIDGDLEGSLNRGGKVALEAGYRLWTLRLSYKYAQQNDLFNRYDRTSQAVVLELSRAVW